MDTQTILPSVFFEIQICQKAIERIVFCLISMFFSLVFRPFLVTFRRRRLRSNGVEGFRGFDTYRQLFKNLKRCGVCVILIFYCSFLVLCGWPCRR